MAMMPGIAQEAAAAPAGYGERLARLDAVIDRFEDATAALENVPGPDIAPRLTRATAAGRELRAEMAALRAADEGRALGGLALAMAEAEAEARGDARGFQRGLAARVPVQRRGRHSAAGAPRPGWQRAALTAVKVIIPAGAAAFGVKTWAAHRILTPVALAAMIGVPAVAVTNMQGTRDATVYGSTASPPSAAAAAVPITSSSPAALTRPKTAVRKARPIVTQVPADGPPSFPVPAVPPPSPSPSASPASLLSLSTAGLDLGVYVAGQVTIGGSPDQPVSWSVTCGQDLAAVPSQGVLEPGQQGFPVRLSVSAVDGASSGTCTFEPGGEVLTVTWAGPGAPSAAAS